MNTFVILFRLGPTPLSDTDKQRRAAETSAWARRINAAGHQLDPRILGPEVARGGSSSAPQTWPVTALLFLHARDLAEATAIAQSHPGLHYGEVEIEVRPWSAPVPATPPAASAVR